MRYRYAAIEREYGSAGTEIAQRLSELSGVPGYGIEIYPVLDSRKPGGEACADLLWKMIMG